MFGRKIAAGVCKFANSPYFRPGRSIGACYFAMLVEANQTMNLTNVTQEDKLSCTLR